MKERYMAEPIKKTTARNHELERCPNTGKQLMTPQWEPIVVSEDIKNVTKNFSK